jgi:hypothetical protein
LGNRGSLRSHSGNLPKPLKIADDLPRVDVSGPEEACLGSPAKGGWLARTCQLEVGVRYDPWIVEAGNSSGMR